MKKSELLEEIKETLQREEDLTDNMRNHSDSQSPSDNLQYDIQLAPMC